MIFSLQVKGQKFNVIVSFPIFKQVKTSCYHIMIPEGGGGGGGWFDGMGEFINPQLSFTSYGSA